MRKGVMRTLGLIGGTTWISTADYYRHINRLTAERLGGSASARLILYSVNFAELMEFVNADDWDGAGAFLSAIAVKLEKAGADAIVLCANTIHLVADVVQKSVSIPVLHIVDAVAKEIESLNLEKVGLLGTRFTMERDFYASRLSAHEIETIIPDAAGRQFVNESIYNEFDKEIFSEETKQKYLEIIDTPIYG